VHNSKESFTDPKQQGGFDVRKNPLPHGLLRGLAQGHGINQETLWIWLPTGHRVAGHRRKEDGLHPQGHHYGRQGCFRVPEQVHASLQDEARQQVAPVAAELEAAGLEVKTRIEPGKPRTKILEIAEEENVSAIILGSHGRGNVAGMLLGSVADHVVRHAKQPVILIKR